MGQNYESLAQTIERDRKILRKVNRDGNSRAARIVVVCCTGCFACGVLFGWLLHKLLSGGL